MIKHYGLDEYNQFSIKSDSPSYRILGPAHALSSLTITVEIMITKEGISPV